jgi:acyl carrier protein
VRDAAVMARADAGGDRRLVAYVVPGPEAPDAAALRAHLKAALPPHMVPSVFVALEAFPFTASGKLDRRALPEPDAAEAGEEYRAPETPTEEALAAIWVEVLRLPRVGTRDDFFAVGGHSLRATQVISRIRASLGVDLPVRALFEHTTIESLALAVEARRAEEDEERRQLEELLARIEGLSPDALEAALGAP